MDDLLEIAKDHTAEALAFALATSDAHPSDVMLECELVNILARAFDAGYALAVERERQMCVDNGCGRDCPPC